MYHYSFAFIAFFCVFTIRAQWTEICYESELAPELPSETIIPFCNDSLGFDYYPNNQPYMDNEVGPFNLECHGINYDIWGHFTYPDTAHGHLCLNISNGTCSHPDGLSNSFGPLEGWALMLWEGQSCDEAELVFSTHCYWMTDIEPGVIATGDWVGITEYDPTRQSWNIVIDNANPGSNYFVQIDSFGWCIGCGNFSWCSELMFLDLPEDSYTPIWESEEKELENGLYHHPHYGVYILHEKHKYNLFGVCLDCK